MFIELNAIKNGGGSTPVLIQTTEIVAVSTATYYADRRYRKTHPCHNLPYCRIELRDAYIFVLEDYFQVWELLRGVSANVEPERK